MHEPARRRRARRPRLAELAAALLVLAGLGARPHDAAGHEPGERPGPAEYSQAAERTDKQARLVQLANELMGAGPPGPGQPASASQSAPAAGQPPNLVDHTNAQDHQNKLVIAGPASPVRHPLADGQQRAGSEPLPAPAPHQQPAGPSGQPAARPADAIAETSTQPAGRSSDLTPELLHDHESDKLSHLGARARHQVGLSSGQLDSFTSLAPKLHSAGWASAHSQPADDGPRAPVVQWAPSARPSLAGAPPSRAHEPAAGPHWPAREARLQSSLSAKHVAPPAPHEPAWPGSPVVGVRPAALAPAGLVMLHQQRPEAGGQRAPLAALRPKSMAGLLPRLAARLFAASGPAGAKPAPGQHQDDALNQQQSFQLAMHNAPPALARGPIFPAPVSIVKNLFGREQLAGQRQKLFAAPRPAAGTPPAPNLLLVHEGRVYSLSGSQPGAGGPELAPKSGGQLLAAAHTYDQQASDTSDFPIFEAMGAHEHRPSGGRTWRPAGARCDRPKHVIQADRAVVDHILQSQQNFVVARVPIRKLARPQPPTAASSLHWAPPGPSQQQAGALYHALPLPLAASAVHQVPSYSLAATAPAALQYQMPATTIEIASSSPRPSILQSIANLIGSLRRRPAAQIATIQTAPAASQMSGSSPPGAILALDGAHSFVLASRSSSGRAHPGSVVARRWHSDDDQEHLISDHSAYAASMISSQFAAGAAPQEQLDPMRRLLMLKTASDSEVCSPIGDLGAKIKYSCVPNSCVVSALASAARGHLQAPGQPHQFRFTDSSAMYKTSNSHEQPSSQQLPAARGHPQADGPIQVQQLYDAPTFGGYPAQQQQALRVTYTHLNAYQTPAISGLVQPQHQQFVSSGQVLDALSDNELGEPFETPAPEPQVGAGGSATLSTRMTTAGPFVPNLAEAQRHAPSGRPEVTYGTAYVRTSSPAAARGRPAMRAHSREESSFEEFGQADGRAPPDGPNEFLSAVDERLERPIRARGRRKQAGAAENGGSSAENALVEQALAQGRLPAPASAAHLQRAAKWPLGAAGRQRQWRPDAPTRGYPHVGAHWSGANGTPPAEWAEPDDEDYDDDDEQRAPPWAPARPQPASSRDSRATGPAPGDDLSRPFAAAGPPGGAPAGRQASAHKARRHNAQLPPPEKHEHDEQPAGQADEADAPAPGAPDDPNATTECDCSTRRPATSAPDPDARPLELEPRERLHPAAQRARPDAAPSSAPLPAARPPGTAPPRHRNSLTTLRPSRGPAPVRQQASARPGAQVTVGREPEAGAHLLKDRRQTPGPWARPGATTGRPYSLRNTTYKNLLLAQHNSAPATLLAHPPAAGDASTTSAAPATGREHLHQDQMDANRQAQFDDSGPDEQQPSSVGRLRLAPGQLDQAGPSAPATRSSRHGPRPPAAGWTGASRRAHLAKTGASRPAGAEQPGAKFTPASVNDIVAQARREQQANATEHQAGSQPAAGSAPPPGEAADARSEPEQSAAGRSIEPGPAGEPDDEQAEVTPHQYQIQVRWHNRSSGAAGRPLAGAVDLMDERVRDRLLEHREEEHWHAKSWLKAGAAKLAEPARLDLGPREPLTPIKDQLAPDADERQTREHFAIPTRNFRQSAEFVDWVQRDVDLDEWPAEPDKRKRKPEAAPTSERAPG